MAIVLIVCLVSVLCLWVIVSYAPGSTVQKVSSPSGENIVVGLNARTPQTSQPISTVIGLSVVDPNRR